MENEEGITVIHSVGEEDLDLLFKVFAKPIQHHDDIDYIAPAWWYLLFASQ
jgi:hypothetical protein